MNINRVCPLCNKASETTDEYLTDCILAQKDWNGFFNYKKLIRRRANVGEVVVGKFER